MTNKNKIINKKSFNFHNFGYFGQSKWIKSFSPVEYESAIEWMKNRVNKIQLNQEISTVWLLEHNNVITGGSLSKEVDLINSDNIPVRKTGRGGQWTWHGPGQRVIYIMMNLNLRNKDVKTYVRNLEEVVIKTLESFNIIAFSRPNFPGVWVKSKYSSRFDKIASIGIRISRWVTYHGISVNINPSLKFFNNIVPCGIQNAGVTSFSELGINSSMNDFDISFSKSFSQVFK